MKKNILKLAGVAFCLVLLATACRNAPIIPESPVISFSIDIQPILAGNCQMSGCHGGTGGGEEKARPLVTYDDVMSNGGIEADNAHNSDLYNRVIDAPGSNVMPPSQYNRLNQQQLLRIYLWIMQGAKNN